MLLLTVR